MKGILTALLTGVTGFFIIMFIQEYETFISPFLKKSTQNYPESEMKNAIETINTFNNLLKNAYIKLSFDILDELPAERHIIEQFILDIKHYRKDNQEFSSVDFESETKDKFFLSDNTVEIAQHEIWIYRIRGVVKQEVNNLYIVYTLKQKNGKWFITDINYSEANEEQGL